MSEITTKERAQRLLDAIRYGSRKFPFQIWDDGEFCAEELIKTLDAIESCERTLAAILELNPSNPAAIKVAREMAKQALGRYGDA